MWHMNAKYVAPILRPSSKNLSLILGSGIIKSHVRAMCRPGLPGRGSLTSNLTAMTIAMTVPTTTTTALTGMTSKLAWTY